MGPINNEPQLFTKPLFESLKRSDKIKEVGLTALARTGKEAKLQKWIRPTPSDAPWDQLVLFSDNFRGLLPPNGILEKDYSRFCAAYDQIAKEEAGKTADVGLKALGQIKEKVEENWDNDFTEGLDKWVRPTPSNTALSNLVIFSDDFKGVLPSNGILETDFTHFCALYDNIATGKTNIKILGDAQFRTEILQALEAILQHRMGRELLDELIKLGIPTEKGKEAPLARIPIDHNSPAMAFFLGSKLFAVYVAPEDAAYVHSLQYDKQHMLVKSPLHITLAHELLHVLHSTRPGYTFKNDADTEELTNSEEQITITGIPGKVERSQGAEYDPWNENRMSGAEQLYFRTTHQWGIRIPTLDSAQPATVYALRKGLENPPGAFDEEIRGLDDEVTTLLKNYLESPFDPLSESASEALELAIYFNREEEIEKCVEKGIPLNQVFSNYLTPLLAALQTDQEELAKRLIEWGAELNPKEGWASPLLYTIIDGNFLFAAWLKGKGAVLTQELQKELMKIVTRTSNFAPLHTLIKLDPSVIPKLFSSMPEELRIECIAHILNDQPSFETTVALLDIFPIIPDEFILTIDFAKDPSTGLQNLLIMKQKGANLNATNDKEETLLHLLIKEYRIKPSNEAQLANTLKELLAAGLDPTKKDRNGMTAADLLDPAADWVLIEALV